MNFRIAHFDDYHDINNAVGKEEKAIELGCYPVSSFGYGRYFALFYTGEKPSAKQVINYIKLRDMVAFGEFLHYRTTEDIGIDEEDFDYEIKRL